VTVQRKRSGLTAAPERCRKCGEAVVGVRKCRCQMGAMPSGRVWINGILRYIDGCDNCGSTLHSSCERTERPLGFIITKGDSR
jgi:hypothetical protein